MKIQILTTNTIQCTGMCPNSEQILRFFGDIITDFEQCVKKILPNNVGSFSHIMVL